MEGMESDMRSRQTRKRERRAWRTAGVALLGLMGGSSGCQWTGDHFVRPTATNPSGATVTSEGTHRPTGSMARTDSNATKDTASVAVTPSADTTPLVAPAANGVVQTSALSDAPSAVVLATARGQADDSPEGEKPSASNRVTADTTDSTANAAPVAALSAPPDAKDNNKAGRGKDAAASKDISKYEVDRTLPSPTTGIDTPAIPVADKSLPITLGASLALAGVENPVIAIADQAIRVARAQQLQAQVLLLPSVNVGASYDLHNGPLQGSIGIIRKTDRQAVYYGMGAGAVAPGTVTIPGLWIVQPLADAVFEPLIARQVVANRRFAATATRYQILLEVSTAYLDLLGAEGRLAVVRQSIKDFQEVANLTAKFSKPGIILERTADANRALADLQELQFEEAKVQEDVATAAAELARLLNLDPSTRLNTGNMPIQIVQFIDPKEPLPRLLEVAARNRPELMAAAAAIRASQTRLRQEQTRPLWPTLWAGFSAGDFGGGAVAVQNPPNFVPTPGNAGAGQPNGHTTPVFGNIASRTDADVMAFWTLENFGLGNIAHVRDRRAQLNGAQASRVAVLNQIRQEVADAYNKSAQHFQGIAIERRRIQEATDGYQRDLKRIIDGVGLPIEVLNNAERLVSARQKLLESVIGFDRAQFQLFVALGQPPTLVVDDDKPSTSPPPLPGPLAELPPTNEKSGEMK